jgi:acetolactate synthase-1/2/3 large subunit
MHLLDSLGRSGIPYVACLHEQGAGYAAIGYAQMTGKLGVVLTTSGPGATNCITPCAAAWTDSVPVLFISGQAKSDTLSHGQRSRGQQEIWIIQMVKPITKGAEQYKSGSYLMYSMPYIVKTALDGRRGPCWISIPLDVQADSA